MQKPNISVNVISETVRTVKGHGVHSAFIDMVEVLKKREDVSVFVNESKKTDIVHVHTTGPFSLWKTLRAKTCVISAHLVPDSLKGSLRFTSLWLPFYSWYLSFFYNRADLLLANSPYTFDELKKMKLKAPTEFLPLGVNREWFRHDEQARKKMREKYSFKEKDFIVISVGQIQPRKDVKTFIEVAQKMPNVQFVWLGGRPFGKLTEGYAEMDALLESPPKNVHFLGEVEYEDVYQYYSMSDMFFMPSVQETFGLVITEAASCGLPVLLRDLDIYKKLFAPYYIAEQSVDGFVTQIQQFMTNSDNMKEQQQKSEELAQKYDTEKMGENLVSKYRSLLEKE